MVVGRTGSARSKFCTAGRWWVEFETGLRGIPIDEVGCGTVIGPMATFGTEAIQDGAGEPFLL